MSRKERKRGNDGGKGRGKEKVGRERGSHEEREGWRREKGMKRMMEIGAGVLQCTLYNAHCTMYFVQCIQCTLEATLFVDTFFTTLLISTCVYRSLHVNTVDPYRVYNTHNYVT